MSQSFKKIQRETNDKNIVLKKKCYYKAIKMIRQVGNIMPQVQFKTNKYV